MASLLDHNFPEVPETYDAEVFARIMRDLEMALTKIEFPEVVSGQDDTNSITWFIESQLLQTLPKSILFSRTRPQTLGLVARIA